MENFKPMLAGKCSVETLNYPLLASPKFDGIRAIVRNGQVLSRTLKPIPNTHVQKLFAHLEGCDGELIVGDPTNKNAMQATTSGVMSVAGDPDVTFHVFDCVSAKPFKTRFDGLVCRLLDGFYLQDPKKRVQIVDQTLCRTRDELEDFEYECLQQGYEGVMVRSHNGLYKFGRSTTREGALLKLKRFVDGEAVCIGIDELLHNENAKDLDNLGHAKRSLSKEGMRPAGTMGALVVKDLATGVVFRVGTGFTAAQRDHFWVNRPTGQIVKYKHFNQQGALNAPRFPTFVGIRSKLDM